MSLKPNKEIIKLYSIAIKFQKDGNKIEAEKFYKKILEINPNHVESINNLGLLYKSLKKIVYAKKFFEMAIIINPKYITSIYNLGNLYSDTLQFEKAIAEYKKVINIEEKNQSALLNIAISYEKLNDPDEAVKYYKKLIAINPKHFIAYNNLAITLDKLNLSEETLFYFKKTIEINPKFSTGFYNVGKIYFALGKNQKAIKYFKEAIRLNPQYANAYNALGLVYNKLCLFKEAEIFYKKTVQIDKSHFRAYNNLGLIYSYHQQDVKKGITFFEKAININSKYTDAYWNLHGCAKNIDQAIEYLNKINKIDKDHEKTKIMTAGLKGFKGDFKDYDFLINSNNSNHPYLTSLKWIFSLKKIPKIVFSRWDFFNNIINLADKDRVFYEYGVLFGTSFKYLVNHFNRGYGFDTFTGLPEDWHDSKPKGTYTSFGKVPKIKGGQFIVGKFEDTLPIFFKVKRDLAGLINFDADLYSSTLCALNYSKDIIDQKTILVFDEFLMNKNWKKDEFKALNEFCKSFNYIYEVVLISLMTKQVAVKIKKL